MRLRNAQTCRAMTIMDNHHWTLPLRCVYFYFVLCFNAVLTFSYCILQRTDTDAPKVVRLLLLHAANPPSHANGGFAATKHEIESYLQNPIRYHSDCSALIQLAIGLASLDLPVLIITIISEYLVSINEEQLFGQYPEHINWKIAALIKKKAQIEN